MMNAIPWIALALLGMVITIATVRDAWKGRKK